MSVKTRREKFDQVALELIHQKGFKATTMRDIATSLSCDVANIYNYVSSKQALLEKFLFSISAAFHDGVDDIASSSYSPTEKLKAVIGLNIRLTHERPYEIALLVNEWRNLKEKELDKFLAERTAYEQKVECILQEGIESGEFKSMDLEIMKYAVLSSVRWLYSTYTGSGPKMNPVELERQITGFVLGGIRA
ncbi:MAG: TetR/AcrR family transcriptional regulator [Bacteroidota bacterium]